MGMYSFHEYSVISAIDGFEETTPFSTFPFFMTCTMFLDVLGARFRTLRPKPSPFDTPSREI